MPQLVHAPRAAGEVAASRRRESRKRHREERKRRPEGEPPPAVPAQAVRDTAPRDISWSGALGAAAGGLVMAAIAIAVVIDPGQGERWWAAIFAAAALAFIPAAWASAAATPHRQRVLKVTTVGCLIAATLGILGFGLGFAVLLALPTTLLATGAGLVFQGGGGKR